MIQRRHLLLAVVPLALAACEKGPNKGYDGFSDRGDLGAKLQAGIWVDPNGCDHWIVDDGVEGYLSPRLDDHGRPVCTGDLPPNTASGPFKSGSGVPDVI